MSSRLVPLLIGAGVLVVLAALSLFSVSETEFAIRTEFGAIVGIHYAPGLHLKWPWDVVTKFDSRILSQSYTRSEEHTSELQSQSNLVCRLLLEQTTLDLSCVQAATYAGENITYTSSSSNVTQCNDMFIYRAPPRVTPLGTYSSGSAA